MRAYRIDAEWIMDKRDRKEAKRREKAAATLEKTGGASESGGGSLSPLSPLSGTHTPGSTDDAETGVYPPEMDEMRCFLWAHGGQDQFMFGFPRVLYLFA